jgi:hypothetical protein
LIIPDPSITPGALNPAVTQATINKTICVAGYSAKIRPPASWTNALKKKQMVQYGFASSWKMSDVEEDHAIAISLGGAPKDARNLWPQPWYGSHGAKKKDVLENYLHRQVCAHRMTLKAAQGAIMPDWVSYCVAHANLNC